MSLVKPQPHSVPVNHQLMSPATCLESYSNRMLSIRRWIFVHKILRALPKLCWKVPQWPRPKSRAAERHSPESTRQDRRSQKFVGGGVDSHKRGIDDMQIPNKRKFKYNHIIVEREIKNGDGRSTFANT